MLNLLEYSQGRNSKHSNTEHNSKSECFEFPILNGSVFERFRFRMVPFSNGSVFERFCFRTVPFLNGTKTMLTIKICVVKVVK